MVTSPLLLFLAGLTHFPVQPSYLEWWASFYNQDRFLSLKYHFFHQKGSEVAWCCGRPEQKHLNRHNPWHWGKFKSIELPWTFKPLKEVQYKRMTCCLSRFGVLLEKGTWILWVWPSSAPSCLSHFFLSLYFWPWLSHTPNT